MAREMGLGVIPWSPLAGGVLTGKYQSQDIQSAATDTSPDRPRRGAVLASGSLSKRGVEIAHLVKEVAQELGRSPAQIALAWTLLNPAVVSPVIGARTTTQLLENIDALSVRLPSEHQNRLSHASESSPGFPHLFLEKLRANGIMFGTLDIAARGN
jgi:aryl-alcohol dehydrogenase-like predicted oxidoreductase